MNIITYADGYGRWHAYVPEDHNDGTGLILDARNAIRDELILRERKTWESKRGAKSRLSAYLREYVTRHPEQDRPGYVHFVEWLQDWERVND